MQRWLLLAMVSAPPVSTAGSEAPHPALGALSMGGDLYGRVQARASAAAQRNGGGGAPASDECDPSAVTMTAVAADESKPIVVNSTVYAQWAWSSTAAAGRRLSLPIGSACTARAARRRCTQTGHVPANHRHF